jgi:hypothetical protein
MSRHGRSFPEKPKGLHSIQVIRAVKLSDLPKNEKEVLEAFIMFGEGTARVRPGIARVAHMACVSPRTVQRMKHRLVERGMLVPVSRTTGGLFPGDVGRYFTEYRVEIESLPHRAPFKGCQPSVSPSGTETATSPGSSYDRLVQQTPPSTSTEGDRTVTPDRSDRADRGNERATKAALRDEIEKRIDAEATATYNALSQEALGELEREARAELRTYLARTAPATHPDLIRRQVLLYLRDARTRRLVRSS